MFGKYLPAVQVLHHFNANSRNNESLDTDVRVWINILLLMQRATLVGKSHKAIEKERPWILRFYYVVPYSLFFVCLLNETWIFSNYMLY